MGGLVFRPLHTPGHTPEHVSYVVLVEDEPVAVFSGGSLLVGAAGRTDLLGAERAESLALLQFGSIRRIAALRDTVALHPTHGPGSYLLGLGRRRRHVVHRGGTRLRTRCWRSATPRPSPAPSSPGSGRTRPTTGTSAPSTSPGQAPYRRMRSPFWTRPRWRVSSTGQSPWSMPGPATSWPRVAFPDHGPSRWATASPPGWGGWCGSPPRSCWSSTTWTRSTRRERRLPGSASPTSSVCSPGWTDGWRRAARSPRTRWSTPPRSPASSPPTTKWSTCAPPRNGKRGTSTVPSTAICPIWRRSSLQGWIAIVRCTSPARAAARRHRRRPVRRRPATDPWSSPVGGYPRSCRRRRTAAPPAR